jgi:hypothetical protein
MVEEACPTSNPLKGSSTFRERDDGRYTPKSDRILRRREVTLWAKTRRTHPQQKSLPFRPRITAKSITDLPSEACYRFPNCNGA